MIATTGPEHVSALTALMYPAMTKRCSHCDGYVAITTDDLMSAITDVVGEPYASLLRSVAQPNAAALLGVPGGPPAAWGGSPGTSRQHSHHEHHGHQGHHEHEQHHDHHWDHHDRHHHGCGCDKCGYHSCRRDDCHCTCCIVDADIVVHARLGERRIVPILIENDRRREREIELDLGEFRTRGGSGTSIKAGVTPASFTLEPCSEREILVMIEARMDSDDGGGKDDGGKDGGAKADPSAKKDKAELDRDAAIAESLGGALRIATRDRIIDVDECVVAYSDLRITGCDNRPIRIAVSVLPRDCHAHTVVCGCGCC